MGATDDLPKLKEECDKLSSLIDENQTGLSSWWMLLQERRNTLLDLLLTPEEKQKIKLNI